MLGENDKVTISKTSALDTVLFVVVAVSIPLRVIYVVLSFPADFGLAKQKNPEASKMTSMVGTILYSWYESCYNFFFSYWPRQDLLSR